MLTPLTFLISDDNSSLQTITTKDVQTTTTTSEDVSQQSSTPGTYNVIYSLTLDPKRQFLYNLYTIARLQGTKELNGIHNLCYQS